MENLFIIGYGLAGGFGGAQNFEVIQEDNLEGAEKQAYENACEYYEQYAGGNGLRTVDEIMSEDDLEEQDAIYAFEEERESWLDYLAMPFSKELEEKYKSYHYQNDFKEITDNL